MCQEIGRIGEKSDRDRTTGGEAADVAAAFQGTDRKEKGGEKKAATNGRREKIMENLRINNIPVHVIIPRSPIKLPCCYSRIVTGPITFFVRLINVRLSKSDGNPAQLSE